MAKIDRLGWAAGLAFNSFGHRIGLRVSEASVLARVTARFPPGWKPAARPEVNCLYSLVVGTSGPKVRRFSLLCREAQRLVRSHDFEEVLATLEDDLKLHVAIAAPARVFLHAGVVGWRGQAIVLPGRSLAGKSTLVEALVRAGAKYFSDEYAVLDSLGRVYPYACPLKLRTRPGESTAPVTLDPADLPAGKRPLPVRLVALTQARAGKPKRSLPEKACWP